MSTMQMGGNGQQTETHEGVESVKIEKNTKGHNWGYRVIRRPDQDWRDVLGTIDFLEAELKRRFGAE
jgi:hypothetical protein